jgi:hypothetical protein
MWLKSWRVLELRSGLSVDFLVTRSRWSNYQMDIPGPTTQVGTRTNYSVGPWDHSTWATRHLLPWSTRTTEDYYSVRKLDMSRSM